MLELIFRGGLEWGYGLILECWEYFSVILMDIMSMDFAYLREHMPVLNSIQQIVLTIGWAILLGNLVFQAAKTMLTGLGFEGEDPKLLFVRTFIFAFLLLASPQICELCLNMTSKMIDLMQVPDAFLHQFGDEGQGRIDVPEGAQRYECDMHTKTPFKQQNSHAGSAGRCPHGCGENR